MNDKYLDIIIWSTIIGILFCIYAGYKFVYEPGQEIMSTIIELPASDSPVRSYGEHAGDRYE